LLTGPFGSGKSASLSVGQRTLTRHLGRTATIDTDILLRMVDPTWELSQDEWDLELCGWQCWLLARSFLNHGFETVIIGSNGFHRTDISPAFVAEEVARMRARHRDWTCRVDNTALTPAATVAEIAVRVNRGEGQVTALLPLE